MRRQQRFCGSSCGTCVAHVRRARLRLTTQCHSAATLLVALLLQGLWEYVQAGARGSGSIGYVTTGPALIELLGTGLGVSC